MKRISIIFPLAALLLTASCSGFLETSPRHQWEVGKTFTTYDKAVQSVNGIYPRFMDGDYLNSDINVNYTDRSGMTKYRDVAYNLSYRQSDNPASYWTTAYSTINACNLAINGIPLVPDSAFPNIEEKDQLIAEARFLRGYMNSIIMLNYCHWWESNMDSPYGIIYRDKTTEVENAYRPRSTVGESWTYIMDDINYGISNMSDDFVTNRKVSKFFAKAYKAKLLLIRGSMVGSQSDLTEAQSLVDGLLSSLPSAIKMESDMSQLYEKSWDSQENIFVRYLEPDKAAASTYGTVGYWSAYGIGQMYHYTRVVDPTTGAELPQSEAVCGIEYGLDWLRSDPRWYIVTGQARAAETWDTSMRWTFTKIYRGGDYARKNEPYDDKFAIYYMRLPELYLIQAELRLRNGSTLADAIAPINTMRGNRTNPVLTAHPTPSTEEAFWDILFREYCQELLLENGSEYFASLRIPKNGKTYMEEIKGPNFTFDRARLQLPLPSGEILNNQYAVQNPGQE